jgi:hypothetical protein
VADKLSDLIAKVQACLSDAGTVNREQRWDKAMDVFLRGVPADAVGVGKTVALIAPEPAEFKSDPQRLTIGHVWGIQHHRGDPGYVGVFLIDGCVRIYRVLKFKPEVEGGNDYVIVDKCTPSVFLS